MMHPITTVPAAEAGTRFLRADISAALFVTPNGPRKTDMAQYMIDISTRTPEEAKSLATDDLKFLLTHDRLGEWGMEALRATLSTLLPDLGITTVGE